MSGKADPLELLRNPSPALIAAVSEAWYGATIGEDDVAWKAVFGVIADHLQRLRPVKTSRGR